MVCLNSEQLRVQYVLRPHLGEMCGDRNKTHFSRADQNGKDTHGYWIKYASTGIALVTYSASTAICTTVLVLVVQVGLTR
jgi:hypothetical protein